MESIKNTGEKSTLKKESSRIPYVTPGLKIFGPVAALTQGGMGSVMEGGMGVAMNMFA